MINQFQIGDFIQYHNDSRISIELRGVVGIVATLADGRSDGLFFADVIRPPGERTHLLMHPSEVNAIDESTYVFHLLKGIQ